MKVYLASPGSQMQAHAARGMPWLVSFACWNPWMDGYMPTASDVILDSGAFSEFNSGKAIDLDAYIEWASRYPWARAVAALDSIRGDTDRTLRNAERFGFPTFHETDPIERLPEFVELARKRGGWLGLGCIPPRAQKARWLRTVCEQIPADIHVHGFALVAYLGTVPRLDSADSTTWWHDAMAMRSRVPAVSHLTLAECTDITVKRYARMGRRVPDEPSAQTALEGV